MRVVKILKINNKLGVGGDIKVGGDFFGSGSINMGGAVDVKIIIGISRWGKISKLVGSRGEIGDATISD